MCGFGWKTPTRYSSRYSGTWARIQKWTLTNRKRMAPQVGLEPTTLRLTAGCSAIELLRSIAEHQTMLPTGVFHHTIRRDN